MSMRGLGTFYSGPPKSGTGPDQLHSKERGKMQREGAEDTIRVVKKMRELGHEDSCCKSLYLSLGPHPFFSGNLLRLEQVRSMKLWLFTRKVVRRKVY